MLKIYGIKNCNSMKKAFDFCDQNNIKFEFHDYKKLGAGADLLKEFIKKFSLEKVINKKGTTYKKLTEKEQNLLCDEKSAIEILSKNTSMIKRPIVIGKSVELIGFDEDEFTQKLL